MYSELGISDKVLEISQKIEENLSERFREIDRIQSLSREEEDA